MLCLIAIIALLAVHAIQWWKEGACVQKVDIISTDKGLDIAWIVPNTYLCEGVDVTVSAGDHVICRRQFDPHARRMLFSDGEHGQRYTVAITAHFGDGRPDASQTETALFLDYDRLPRLPLLVINTRSGEDPSYEEANKPYDHLWGNTQTNNLYLEGEYLFVGTDGESFSDRLKIRTRGNSSCIFLDKKPYKIVLNDSVDLLGQDRDGAHREWALLNSGHSLNDYVCDRVSRLCGVEWQRDAGFVNVMLNGDWKGCYYLTETVGIDAADGLVSDTGYILEDDPYWWNADGLSFRTNGQIDQLAYTLKYPSIRTTSDRRVARIRQYMNEYEGFLLSGDAAYRDYIDEDSFARWFLVRDITGILDGGGANIYFYKYDFDPKNPTSSKLKMGPLWDHDSAFQNVDRWASSREEFIAHFSTLFAQQSFFDCYTGAWMGVRDTLYADVERELSELIAQDGEALEESWKLDAARWGVDVKPPQEQAAAVLTWFDRRAEWMDRGLGIPAAVDVSTYAHYGGLRFSVDSRTDSNGGLTSIAGWAFVDGREGDESLKIGWVAEDGAVYFSTGAQERQDVMEAYGLATPLVGFTIYTRQDGRICAIDTENRTIYEAD